MAKASMSEPTRRRPALRHICTGMLSDRELAPTGRIPDHDEQANYAIALLDIANDLAH